MESEQPKPTKGRETFLAFFLAVFLGGACLVFLNIVSLGFVTYVLAAVAVMAAVGGLHYVAWGRTFTRQVAQERAEMEAQERSEAEQETFRRHHFRRRF